MINIAQDDVAAALLSATGLGVSVGERWLLRDVDLVLQPGRAVVVFGPSGAGKSTLAKAVAGVEMPGRRVVGRLQQRDGQPVRVGYLPQDAAQTLNPARRIGPALTELVALRPGRTRRRSRRTERRLRRADVKAVLARAAFEAADGLLDRFPHEFSGGQRTRLALAQVLAVDPDLLVLDEPTAGLDAVSRAELINVLCGLRDAGQSILVVSHDRYVVQRLADHTLSVRDGRVSRTESIAVVGADRDDRVLAPCRASRDRLQVSDLSVRFGGSTVLSDLTMSIAEGEQLALVGRSGAGKSTLGRVLAGLTRPTSGVVAWDGTPLRPLSRRSRRRIAQIQYVWQEADASFDPRRTILDQVAATAVRLRRLPVVEARSEAAAVLTELALSPAEIRRRPGQLSGGQLRRAALARALLARPDLLICDEIGTGLDPALAEVIYRTVDRYRRDSGASVLAIGHDLSDQLRHADRIALMDGGRIVEVRTVEDQGPGSPPMRELLTAARP
ncbi:ABC transporter ATP-binding protein [Microlunatus soli]|uniref:Peptide/nickel transport system ATP-binding protein n=1 Tax=Microlunatus soli TaxID=630515 RepID=A0A1H1Z087_9ACTN|nr:ATP-binding cassette domain-containing protein [Microlunatus soli]SDT27100.1 peptide/nickel transport system ATP-binding protein [Microlunatus soli]